MAGTIYEAIHHAVFSNFLFFATIKAYRLISTVPKPCLQTFLDVTEQVTHIAIKILYKKLILKLQYLVSEMRKGCKTLQSCSVQFYKFISSKFLHPPILIA